MTYRTQKVCAHKATRYHFRDPTIASPSQEAYFNTTIPTPQSDLDQIAVKFDDVYALIHEKILNLGRVLSQRILPAAQISPSLRYGRIQRATDDVDWNR